MFLVLILLLTAELFSQTVEDSLLVPGWNPNGLVGINLSQISFKDWTQGGTDALAFTVFSNFGVVYYSHPWKWKTYLKSAFGRTKLGDEYRTTDNEIYFESLILRDIDWAVDPYFAVTVRTAITKGYDYETDPKTQIVNFFDPGYITEAAGFMYSTGKVFSSRLGVALQQTFASDFAAKYTDDVDTPAEIEDFKFETGLESVTEVNYDFYDNMAYKSFLRLFSRFNSLDVWDVRWDNTIAAKVNDFITVNFNVVLIHEISQSRRTQLKQALNIGIVYTLF